MINSEFGRDNRVYLSMLQFIASSVMKCSELEGILDTSAGEYLKRLESEYGLVRMKLP